MNPFYFGVGPRRLFGIYHPAQGRPASARAVVVCHPWGQEYLRAHRSVRHLATLLARAGVHVLRFDYFGTGDSAGDMVDGDVAGWQGDIEMAIEEMKDTTGASKVGLVGLRLGGTLAAAVASRRREDVEALVLWDPIVRGADYVRELRAVAASPSTPRVGGSGGQVDEVLGFALTDRLARELGSLDLLAAVPSLPVRTLVVATDPSGARAVGTLTVASVVAAPAWVEDQNSGVGAIPVAALQRIAAWFA